MKLNRKYNLRIQIDFDRHPKGGKKALLEIVEFYRMADEIFGDD